MRLEKSSPAIDTPMREKKFGSLLRFKIEKDFDARYAESDMYINSYRNI